MDNGTLVFVVFAVIIISAAVFAGSFRVSIDPLAPRPRRRLANELLGVGLLGAVIASVVWNRPIPGCYPVEEGPATIRAGITFLLMAGVLIPSYFLPAHNAVFRLLSSWAENAPRLSGREGLLFVGGVFGLVGVCLVLVGSGLFG